MKRVSVTVAAVVIVAAGIAPAAAGGVLGLDGHISYYGSQLPFAGVPVALDGVGALSSPTDGSGAFAFGGLDVGTWQLEPRLTGMQHGGVTALDAVYALQAAAGLRTLSPEQLIACDVNGSGTLTAIDASLILQYSVGLLNQFPVATTCGSDWVFVPKMTESASVRVVLPQISAGSCQPGRVVYDLTTPFTSQDFEAIKFGDCTGDWQPPAVPSPTPIPSPTPTPNCGGSAASTLLSPLLIAAHPDVRDASGALRQGRAHIITTVPTDNGWGVFWLRDLTENTFDVRAVSTLYYAHVGLDGALSAGPLALVDIHRHDREPLYLVAWHTDHFGLLVNELVNTDISNKITYQYYYDVSIDGQLSARVGPIRTDLGFSGGIGDMIPYLNGFMVGIETVCQGSHQCTFAFKLADHGASRGSDLHVVEFDGTHSFAPRFADDGSGLVVVSSKDFASLSGGVVSQYIRNSGGSIGFSKPINPNKGFLLDNSPHVAWNGQRFGAVWREVQSLIPPGDSNWRIRLATFNRTTSTSTLLSDRFLEPAYVPGLSIGRSVASTTDISAVPDGWVVSYASGQAGGEPQAVIQYLTPDGDQRAIWAPFGLDDYSLSTRAHFRAGYQRTIGVAASHRTGEGVEVRFSKLNLDCPP